MKKLVLISLVLALLVLSVTPAFAAAEKNGKNGKGGNPGGNGLGRGNFVLTGTITAVDTTALTVTVKVLKGNRLVRQVLNQEVTIQTTSSTRIFIKTKNGIMKGTLADLVVNQKAVVQGRLKDNIWTARKILADARPPKTPKPPAH